MSDKLTNTSVEILGKVYSIRCPEEEINNLNQAAQYLNDKMQEVKESGKAINLERIAIMAALNITHELIQNKDQVGLVDKINQKLTSLNDKLSFVVSDSVTEQA